MRDTAAQVRLQLFGRDKTRMKIKMKKSANTSATMLCHSQKFYYFRFMCCYCVNIIILSPRQCVAIFTRPHTYSDARTQTRRHHKQTCIRMSGAHAAQFLHISLRNCPSHFPFIYVSRHHSIFRCIFDLPEV